MANGNLVQVCLGWASCGGWGAAVGGMPIRGGGRVDDGGRYKGYKGNGRHQNI